MARKTWLGVNSSYTTDSNWLPISVRNATYRWTLSASGTSNYYLELTGGGNPGLTQPANVQAGGTNLTSATAGSLTASQWGWGNVDVLGFNTIYVRLSDSADPDAKDINFVTYTQIPVSGDDVRIPVDSGAIAGSDQSAVTLASFVVEEGFDEGIGSSTTALRITTSRFDFHGNGNTAAYIDLAGSTCSPQIFNTASTTRGNRGLYLIGTALNTISVIDGDVGIASRHHETATVTTVRSIGLGANVWVGAGCTLTTFYQDDGDNQLRAAATTVTCYGGTLRTKETGTIGTFNVYGGTIYPESTGTISTMLVDGGSVDFTSSGAARTVTNLKHNSGSLHYDPNYLTVTTRQAPDHPITLTGSRG